MHSLIIHSASLVGAAWLMNRRRRYRRRAQPLDDRQRAALAPWFETDLLARVRVVHVPAIRRPLAYAVLSAAGCHPPMDFAGVSGMALDDTVILAPPRRGVDPRGLLFHELVHISQFEMLGVRPFVSAYLRGWLESGRNYFAIPLERQAFALQDRYLAAQEFKVSVELRLLMQAGANMEAA
jgi:hypothetical protein